MRSVRFTLVEVSLIGRALALCSTVESFDQSVSDRIVTKLLAATAASPGVAIAPIEEAMIKSARGKIIPLIGGHAKASVRAAQVHATPEDAALIGEWVARQGWLHGPQTVFDVFNKWDQWLAKAAATHPPPLAREGFESGAGVTNEAGRSIDRTSSRTPGRRPPGF